MLRAVDDVWQEVLWWFDLKLALVSLYFTPNLVGLVQKNTNLGSDIGMSQHFKRLIALPLLNEIMDCTNQVQTVSCLSYLSFVLFVLSNLSYKSHYL